MLLEGELVHYQLAVIQWSCPIFCHELENLDTLTPCDHQILKRTGVMQSVDVVTNLSVSDVHKVLCGEAELGRFESIK